MFRNAAAEVSTSAARIPRRRPDHARSAADPQAGPGEAESWPAETETAGPAAGRSGALEALEPKPRERRLAVGCGRGTGAEGHESRGQCAESNEARQ